MIFTETKLPGAYTISVERLEDERGFFARGFCINEFNGYGLNGHIVQANISYNRKRGTLRGLHMQKAPFEEVKIVRCTRGAVYDVIVDMRRQSPTFKQWIGVELTADNYQMLYVPEGFAHSYITLEDNTEVLYNVTQFYHPGSETGFRWDDPAFDITWPVEPVIISERDRSHPLLQTVVA